MAYGTTPCEECGAQIEQVGGRGRKRLTCDECQSAKPREYQCVGCGGTFEEPGRKGRGRRWCLACEADTHRHTAAHERRKRRIARRRSAQRKLARAAEGIGRHRHFWCGDCVICGDGFTAIRPERCCSPKCSAEWKSLKNARREAKKVRFDETVRGNLIVRDGPACHWCGKRASENPEDGSWAIPVAELLVPVEEGGTVALTNLVLSHQDCQRSTAEGGRTVESVSSLLLGSPSRSR